TEVTCRRLPHAVDAVACETGGLGIGQARFWMDRGYLELTPGRNGSGLSQRRQICFEVVAPGDFFSYGQGLYGSRGADLVARGQPFDDRALPHFHLTLNYTDVRTCIARLH